MADNTKAKDNLPVLSDEIATFSGAEIEPAHAQRIKLVAGADGAAYDLEGVYAYAAGTAPATVDLPATARLKRVSVIAGSGGAATVTIGGGATITIPSDGSFDELIPGVAVGADVVLGGDVDSYYVSWVA
jgi:hypothetical protein